MGTKNTAGVKHSDKVYRYQRSCGISGMSGTLAAVFIHTSELKITKDTYLISSKGELVVLLKK